MRLDYKKMQEELLPDQETQDRLWKSIEKRAADDRMQIPQNKTRMKKEMWAVCSTVAAVFALIIFLPQTSLADKIMEGLVEKFFYTESAIMPEIVRIPYKGSTTYRVLLEKGVQVSIPSEAAKKKADQPARIISYKVIGNQDMVYAYMTNAKGERVTSGSVCFSDTPEVQGKAAPYQSGKGKKGAFYQLKLGLDPRSKNNSLVVEVTFIP